jgi:hypothetical protein
MGRNQEDHTGMVQVELDEEARNERARSNSAAQVELDALVAKKDSHNREWNEQIKQLESRISLLANEAETGLAWVNRQETMFGANDVDEEPAEEADEQAPKRGRGGRRKRAAGAGVSDVA